MLRSFLPGCFCHQPWPRYRNLLYSWLSWGRWRCRWCIEWGGYWDQGSARTDYQCLSSKMRKRQTSADTESGCWVRDPGGKTGVWSAQHPRGAERGGRLYCGTGLSPPASHLTRLTGWHSRMWWWFPDPAIHAGYQRHVCMRLLIILTRTV